MEDSKFLKWKMEQVWNRKGVVCPGHLVRWYTFETGYQFWWKSPAGFMTVLLWYKKGTKRDIKRAKVKGKGFSFLPKNYRIALCQKENE